MADRRLVKIEGTADLNGFWAVSVDFLAQRLKAQFDNLGFDVQGIQIVDQSFFNNAINIVLSFNVLYQYGNQDALRSATSVLQNYQENGSTQLSNINLRVTYDAGVPNTQTMQPITASGKGNDKTPTVNGGNLGTVNIDINDDDTPKTNNTALLLCAVGLILIIKKL